MNCLQAVGDGTDRVGNGRLFEGETQEDDVILVIFDLQDPGLGQGCDGVRR
jgi:hypothetical protein